MNQHLELLLLWAGGLSLLGLATVVLGVPWVVARLPPDYFNQAHRAVWRSSGEEPWFALVLGGLKNLVGAVLVLTAALPIAGVPALGPTWTASLVAWMLASAVHAAWLAQTSAAALEPAAPPVPAPPVPTPPIDRRPPKD